MGSLLAPLLVRALGTRAFLVAALVPLAAFVHAMFAGPAVLAGAAVSERVAWIAELDLSVAVRLDTLSWVLALVVSGVGTLVLLYCARYFGDDEPNLGRFAEFATFAPRRRGNGAEVAISSDRVGRESRGERPGSSCARGPSARSPSVE